MSEHEDENMRQDGERDQDSFPPISRADLTEPIGTKIGPYKLLSVLGEGGFGIVYLAEQKKPVRRKVALKVIKPGMDSKQVIARFEAERQALALLDHPNVAHVFDAGTTEKGRPYFAMEHVEGTPITEHCDRAKLPIEQRLKLFLQICQAVRYSHLKGIIHRDIKPSNILVSVREGKALPKIIDFGVAKALSQPLTERTLFTEKGQLIGTPEYMSPEQAEMTNQDIDTRTDIYSLGVLLYVLLTGILPFDSQTLRKGGIERIRRMISEEEPKRPSTRISSVSAEELTILAEKRKTDIRSLRLELRSDLDWITMKAMEKDRDRRFETAHALAEDIQRHLDHEPVLAAPPSSLYRLQKFLHKHRSRLVAGVMSAILLLSIVLTVFVYYRFQTERSRNEEVRDNQELREIELLLYQKAPGMPSALPDIEETVDPFFILAQQTLVHEASSKNPTEGNGTKSDSEIKYHFDVLTGILSKIDDLWDSKYVEHKVHLLKAVIRFRMENFRAAREILEELLDIEEVACLAHFVLAQTYRKGPDKDEKKAKGLEDKAETLAKASGTDLELNYYKALASKDINYTLERLNEALDINRGHIPSRIARAKTHYVLEDYEKMERDADIITVLQQENPIGYALHAVALRQLGEYAKAIKAHTEAIRLTNKDDPMYSELYFERYKTHVLDYNYEQARDDAEEWIGYFKKRPDKYGSDFASFLRYIRSGNDEEAKNKYNDIVPIGYSKEQRQLQKADFRAKCEKYVFDVLGIGQDVNLPEDSKQEPAFWSMYEARKYYRKLIATKNRKKLVRGFKATWSPDGNRLAYTRLIPLTNGHFDTSYNGIEIRDLTSGECQLTVVPGKDPAWSPDGKHIAFVRQRWATTKKTRSSSVEKDGIWIMKSDGSKARFLAKGGFPSWSQDSKRVYFHSRERSYLCSISIDDKAPPQNHLPCRSYYPAVSPKETFVAFSEWQEATEKREIKIVKLSGDSKGSVVTKWSPPYDRGMLVHWSPDERELSIGGYDDSDLGLWIYNLERKTATKVINGPVTQGVWSPAMDRMTFDFRAPFYEIWITDLDPNISTAKALGSSQNIDQHLDYLYDNYERAIDSNAVDASNRVSMYRLMKNHYPRFSEQYRKKSNADALESIIRISTLYRAVYDKDYFYGPYYMALLHYRLSQFAKAEAALDRLRKIYEDNRYSKYRKYLFDAEKFLAGKNTKAYDLWDHIEKRDLSKASELLTYLKSEPSDDDPYIAGRIQSASKQLFWEYLDHGQSSERAGQYDRAIADLESAIKIDPNHITALNSFAWLKATCPKAQYRDGNVAIEKAVRACELTSWKECAYLDTLAAAYAESGDYEEALRWQKEAITLLSEDDRAEQQALYESRLTLYQSGKPYRSFSIDRMVGWWKFDESSGITALDSSGRGNHGTLHGNPKWVEGTIGGALDLDGSDFVTIDGVVDDLTSNNITVSAWVKTTTTGEGNLFASNSSGHYHAFLFGIQGGNVYVSDNATDEGHARIAVNDGQWHMWTYVRRGARGYIYIDAVQESTHSANFNLTTETQWSIGQEWDPSGASDFLTGTVDDARFYTISLTQPQITELMRGPLMAWNPSLNNNSMIDINAVKKPLTWMAGDGATEHDVYFGPTKKQVSDADASDTTGIYQGRQGTASYTLPAGSVEWGGGPYYWRVDEVNAEGSISTGATRSFSVADYLIVALMKMN